jgi:hypothetical protein
MSLDFDLVFSSLRLKTKARLLAGPFIFSIYV